MIEFWHPTPISYYDLSVDELFVVKNEIKNNEYVIYEHLEKNQWHDNVRSTLTLNCFNILEKFNFKNTLFTIEKYILLFIKEWYENHSNVSTVKSNFYISESWFNYVDHLGFQGLHTHNTNQKNLNFLSGVFFYDEEFTKHEQFQFSKLIFELDSNYNFYDQQKYVSYDYIPGRIIMFPSSLPHKVLFNQTNQTRKSISFNILEK